jgi:glutamate/tyrosine decarboxylase-like PLP-dependent enzyme
MTLASGFADWITTSGIFELTAPTAVPIVNFRLRNSGSGEQLAHSHLELVERVTRDGQRWISETRVQGRSVLRMMVISYLTGQQQLTGLQDALQQAAKELRAEAPK